MQQVFTLKSPQGRKERGKEIISEEAGGKVRKRRVTNKMRTRRGEHLLEIYPSVILVEPGGRSH